MRKVLEFIDNKRSIIISTLLAAFAISWVIFVCIVANRIAEAERMHLVQQDRNTPMTIELSDGSLVDIGEKE